MRLFSKTSLFYWEGKCGDGLKPSWFRDDIFNDDLQMFFAIPVIPLGAIGDFFETVGNRQLAGDIELNGRDGAVSARTAFKNHFPMVFPHGPAIFNPDARIHEQRVRVALAKGTQTLQFLPSVRV
jgi:hypothetical protein